MRISTAAFFLLTAFPLAACVHETAVFHSLNGVNYFRDGSVERPGSTGAPDTSLSPIGEPVPSR